MSIGYTCSNGCFVNASEVAAYMTHFYANQCVETLLVSLGKGVCRFMKFVHLTPQSQLGRVTRNGIRLGNGRGGRGVYAVPLLLLQRLTWLDDDTVIEADPRSSTTLWHWLSTLRQRHRHLAAVTFTTSADHWPATLYLTLTAAVGTSWLQNIKADTIHITEENLKFVRDAHRERYLADLKVTVRTAAGLGQLLSVVQAAGLTTWDRYDETIELLFPSQSPPARSQKSPPSFAQTNSSNRPDSEVMRKSENDANQAESGSDPLSVFFGIKVLDLQKEDS